MKLSLAANNLYINLALFCVSCFVCIYCCDFTFFPFVLEVTVLHKTDKSSIKLE